MKKIEKKSWDECMFRAAVWIVLIIVGSAVTTALWQLHLVTTTLVLAIVLVLIYKFPWFWNKYVDYKEGEK